MMTPGSLIALAPTNPTYNWWYNCGAIWNGKPEGFKFDP